MPTSLDISFAVLFSVVIVAAEALYFDRKFKAQVAAGVPDARLNAYRRVTVGQWAIAAIALLIWQRSGRPWSALWLVPPQDWRLVAGLVVIALIVAFTMTQLRAVQRLRTKLERRVELRERLRQLEFILPHTPAEHRWFGVVSLTAGVCEELLYRGFLTWLLASYVGLPGAIAVVVIGFGLGHAYQGWRGVIKTGTVGLVMSLIVVLTGWLVPAMVVHFLVDLGSGALGYAVYSDAIPSRPVENGVER